MAICVLVQVGRGGRSAPRERELERLSRELQGHLESIEMKRGGAAEREAGPEARETLESLGAIKRVGDDDPDVASAHRIEREMKAIVDQDLAVEHGYKPSERWSIDMVLSAFIHGGWFHLLG